MQLKQCYAAARSIRAAFCSLLIQLQNSLSVMLLLCKHFCVGAPESRSDAKGNNGGWGECCAVITPFPRPQGVQVNEAACDLAREVANEGDALVAGGVSQTPSYLSCKSEAQVKSIFKKQMDVFVKKNVDFLIAEVRQSCLAENFISPF